MAILGTKSNIYQSDSAKGMPKGFIVFQRKKIGF